MTLAATIEPGFGVGVYSFPQAAHILSPVNSETLRRWVRTGLTPPSYERGGGVSEVLSFHDLVSLELVRRMRQEGISLQKIRVLESELRRVRAGTARPFALEIFWTDGKDVWYQLEPGDTRLVQATGRDRRQIGWKEAIASFAHELDYREGVAVRWRPRPHVEINPSIQFGEPVVEGTRIPVATIRANLDVGSVEEVAGWYDLTAEQVGAARDYAAALS